MNFKQIVDAYEKQHDQLCNKLMEKANARIRELVARVARFNIRQIIVGMGTWTLDAPDFVAVGECEEDGEETRPIVDLIDWVAEVAYRGNKFDLGWCPKDITDDEIDALTELYHMEVWMEDRIGGTDVSFE